MSRSHRLNRDFQSRDEAEGENSLKKISRAVLAFFTFIKLHIRFIFSYSVSFSVTKIVFGLLRT